MLLPLKRRVTPLEHVAATEAEMSSARACCCNDASTTSRPNSMCARLRICCLVLDHLLVLRLIALLPTSPFARRRLLNACAKRAQRVRRHWKACGKRSIHCRYTHTHSNQTYPSRYTHPSKYTHTHSSSHSQNTYPSRYTHTLKLALRQSTAEINSAQ
jgi:hypothetical protein